MDRNRQLLRVLRILFDLIQSGEPVAIKELAIRYRVHPKTIRRDLKAIAESPFGIIEIQGDAPKFSTKKRFRLTHDP